MMIIGAFQALIFCSGLVEDKIDQIHVPVKPSDNLDNVKEQYRLSKERKRLSTDGKSVIKGAVVNAGTSEHRARIDSSEEVDQESKDEEK